MDLSGILQTTAAVILANTATAAFALGLFVTWKKQTKEQIGNDELPLLVYPCLVIPPAIIAWGFFLIPVQ